jgi:hypothetical protein
MHDTPAQGALLGSSSDVNVFFQDIIESLIHQLSKFAQVHIS